MAFRKKFVSLLRLDPDLMFIQECEHPSKIANISEEYDTVWIGDNANKGLAAFIKKGLNHQNIEMQKEGVRSALGIDVEDYKIISFWAMDDGLNIKNRYIGQVWNWLSLNRDLIDSRTIILGDFNWNVIWDKRLTCPISGNFEDVWRLLAGYNIFSAYHHLNKEEFGKEKQGTFFMHKEETNRYHTDYVFTSNAMLDRMNRFEIGQFMDWIGLSDHMPILFDFNHRI